MGLIWIAIVGVAGFSLLKIGSRLRAANSDIRVFQFKYQLATLALGLAVFALSGSFGRWITLFGELDAPATELSYLGASNTDTWLNIGLTFALIMGVVTLVVVWLQSGRGNRSSWRQVAVNLPLVLAFSLANSLTEELIFRVSLVQGIGGQLPSWGVALLSAILFGGVHYFGQPGKIPGVLMAGFMGWLLTYSVIQTGGLFWAWFIHFIQDCIIFAIVFGKTKSDLASN